MTDSLMKYCEDVFEPDCYMSLTNWKMWWEYQRDMCSLAMNEITRKEVLWSNEKYHQQNFKKKWSYFTAWHAECDLVLDNHENEVLMKWFVLYSRSDFW